jgi:hypothetical protein
MFIVTYCIAVGIKEILVPEDVIIAPKHVGATLNVVRKNYRVEHL